MSLWGISLSDITLCELYFGAFNKAELQFIKKSVSGLPVFSITSEISMIAVNLMEKYCLSLNYLCLMPTLLLLLSIITLNFLRSI